jgi:GNAT superfamily N-acetyltransferase
VSWANQKTFRKHVIPPHQKDYLMQVMIDRFSKKIRDIKILGVAATLRKAFRDHIFSVDHVLILARRLSEPLPFRKLSLSGLSISVHSTQEGIAKLCKTYPDRAHVFHNYIDDGHEVAIATRDNMAVGYTWVATRDFFDKYLNRREFRIGPGQIYVFAGFVHPDYRGTPVALGMMFEINEVFSDRGYEEVLVAISSGNRESVRFHAKTRYQPTGEAFDCHKLFSYRWTRDAEARADALAAYRR